jgi:hypothetical protein
MIPVILIHKNFQEYLKYSIQQSSKNNQVILLGNTDPKLLLPNFKFINYEHYTEEIKRFADKYQHLSTNSYDYELFCYQRWFILKNFMIDQKLEIVFYIDSDVLLFSNVEEEWAKFIQYDMTLLHRTAAISSFITLRGLENFCNMLEYIYTNKNGYHFKKIESHYKIRQEFGLSGGVCDMTLLEYFHYNSEFGGGPGRVGEMMTIIENSTYDHNINVADQDFKMKSGRKDIKIIDKKPYVFNEKLKRDVKFNTLHFQGGSKNLMFDIYARCN